jgi:hypothetical protein
MQVGRYTRGLVAALALGGLVLGLSAGQAEAKPKIDTGVRCAMFNTSSGEWEFYLPGEPAFVIGGDGKIHRLECGPDGHWTDVGTLPDRVVGPHPVGPRVDAPRLPTAQ